MHAHAGQGQAPTEPLEGLAWVVQVSDLHLSAFNYLPDQYAHFGDKEGDLRCVRAHTWLRYKAQAGFLIVKKRCLLALTVLAVAAALFAPDAAASTKCLPASMQQKF